MVNYRQLEITAEKVARLLAVYERFRVVERTPLAVRFGSENGARIEEGDLWGADFEYGNFYAELPVEGAGAYLECDTGAVEHLVFADGRVIGMSDWVRGAAVPAERRHRFVPLSGLRVGARLRVEGYASHTFFGTMPYEGKQTFALAAHRERVPFRGVYLIRLDEGLARLCENLNLFFSYYRAKQKSLEKALFSVSERLFALLSRLPERPAADAVVEANAELERFFASLRPSAGTPVVGLVGHSHLDTAWLWTTEETRRKAARTAVNAVNLLEKYPEYRFVMSSVLYLDWFRTDYPDLFARIAKLVGEGRFEPNGAAWVECDCNLTGGEALIRQFLRGQHFLQTYFGYRADAFLLPDTFGYSAALPQIMRGCGVRYFLTTKLSWNDTNRFPYDAFRWRGIDGSVVTAHFNTIHCPANPETVAARTEGMAMRYLNDRALISYGYGDGGGGPDEETVRIALKTQETYPFARVGHTTVSAFMEDLARQKLPDYAGELYLELHRGTLTMHHDLKRFNRKLEISLHDAEYLAVAENAPERRGELARRWDTLLLNQFHDILPGTCIARVNDTAKAELGAALAACEAEVRGGDAPYVNTLSCAREETLDAADGEQTYCDFDGTERRLARFRFAPFGGGTRVKAAKRSPFSVDGERIVTPFLSAVLREGRVVSYVYGGRDFAAGALGDLRVAEDVPRVWDNWDVDADLGLLERPVPCVGTELISDGPHELRFRVRFAIGERSSLVQDVVFDAYSPRVVFENRLDWQDDHKLLRAYFETDLFAPRVKSEIQFGWAERPTTRNTSAEQAMFEVCNHKWSDLSETGAGLALLNDCKYGFGCEGGVMHLTLAKGGTHPDERGDRGVKYFSYCLLPHTGGFSAENVVWPAYRFNNPPARSVVARSPVVAVDRANIVVETVKFGEDGGIVLRLYECERSKTSCRLTLSQSFACEECNLLEEPLLTLGETEALDLTFRPFEIKTLRLKYVNEI